MKKFVRFLLFIAGAFVLINSVFFIPGVARFYHQVVLGKQVHHSNYEMESIGAEFSAFLNDPYPNIATLHLTPGRYTWGDVVDKYGIYGPETKGMLFRFLVLKNEDLLVTVAEDYAAEFWNRRDSLKSIGLESKIFNDRILVPNLAHLQIKNPSVQDAEIQASMQRAFSLAEGNPIIQSIRMPEYGNTVFIHRREVNPGVKENTPYVMGTTSAGALSNTKNFLVRFRICGQVKILIGSLFDGCNYDNAPPLGCQNLVLARVEDNPINQALRQSEVITFVPGDEKNNPYYLIKPTEGCVEVDFIFHCTHLGLNRPTFPLQLVPIIIKERKGLHPERISQTEEFSQPKPWIKSNHQFMVQGDPENIRIYHDKVYNAFKAYLYGIVKGSFPNLSQSAFEKTLSIKKDDFIGGVVPHNPHNPLNNFIEKQVTCTDDVGEEIQLGTFRDLYKNTLPGDKTVFVFSLL